MTFKGHSRSLAMHNQTKQLSELFLSLLVSKVKKIFHPIQPIFFILNEFTVCIMACINAKKTQLVWLGTRQQLTRPGWLSLNFHWSQLYWYQQFKWYRSDCDWSWSCSGCSADNCSSHFISIPGWFLAAMPTVVCSLVSEATWALV